MGNLFLYVVYISVALKGRRPAAYGIASENSGDPKDRPPAKSLSPSFQKGSVSVVIFGSPSSR
jgi:hypothetical protein